MDNKYILSFDTSGNYLGLILTNNGLITSKLEFNKPNLHDKYLAFLVKTILEINEIEVSDLTAIGVVSGPGSFTGLRIGVALAKGLCYEDGITNSPKLISISTLESLALNFCFNYYQQLQDKKQNVKQNIILRTLLKSHKNVYYSQIFELNNCIENFDFSIENLKPITEVELIELSNETNFDEDFIISINEDLNVYENLKTKVFLIQNSIESTAKLVCYKNNLGLFENPETFTPLYSQEFNITKA